MNWEDLKRVNSNLTTTDVKGKDYVEVNKRVMAFRELVPDGAIATDIISLENGVVVMKATVTDGDGKILGTGLAYEKESSSFINKTSYIENCETSAVGRALGFCGIGITTSIASFEEVANAVQQQEGDKPITATHAKAIRERIKKLDGLTETKICETYNIKSLEELTMSNLMDCNKRLNDYETALKKKQKEA